MPLPWFLDDPDGARSAIGDDGRDVVVVCKAGGRARSAARILAGAGCEALVLDGGMLAWAADVDPSLPRY